MKVIAIIYKQRKKTLSLGSTDCNLSSSSGETLHNTASTHTNKLLGNSRGQTNLITRTSNVLVIKIIICSTVV